MRYAGKPLRIKGTVQRDDPDWPRWAWLPGWLCHVEANHPGVGSFTMEVTVTDAEGKPTEVMEIAVTPRRLLGG